MLRDADAIVREEIGQVPAAQADQYFAVLTSIRSVGVMGDFRTYDYTVAVRAVRTNGFHDLRISPGFPTTFCINISNRITNEVSGREPRGIRHHRPSPRPPSNGNNEPKCRKSVFMQTSGICFTQGGKSHEKL